MNQNNKNDKVFGAFLGTIVEYYDYSLYGFSAHILASKFFPNIDPMLSLLNVFSIYALSHVMKPLGAIFFSKLGDKYGRKKALEITIIGIAFPTIIIGLIPEHQILGIISTIILIICRLMQGFFLAGEYDGAAIYIIEHLGKRYKYTASALTRFTGVLGLLLGIASTNFFNSSLFPEYCWRIPFLLSAPLALLTMKYRKNLTETPEFLSDKENAYTIYEFIPFIKKRYNSIIPIILLAGSFGVLYQVSIIFFKQYLPIVMPASSTIITTISMFAVLIFGVSMPAAGILADKFGLMPVIKTSLACSFIILILLYVGLVNEIFNLVLVSALLLAMMVAPINALAHGLMTNSFSVRERYRGVSIGHAVGSMLMSGTANFICIYMIREYELVYFPIFYIMVFVIIGYVSAVKLTSTK